ncbi:MAG: ribosomal RNA small subunit methyltransferase A [Deltaproteobacteria bacterium]|nr:ribosomal RNA small subunit methyltransferase A [Deltaproteobacteria bacterium]
MSDGSSPLDVRALLARHGIAPNRALGQSFLIDANVVAKIVGAALRHSPSELIEIGPGLGSLTLPLANEGLRLVAVERDPRLIPVLEALFAHHPNVEVVNGDATKVDLARLARAPRPTVVGNLPYSVTTPILLALLRQRDRLGPGCFMVQREVADRLIAPAGSRDYGSLTVLFRAVADVTKAFDVSPRCFRPVPKVTSTVLTLSWLESPRVDVPLDILEATTRAAFGQRRKMLRNALRARFLPEAVTRAENVVDLSRRAETLELSELSALARALAKD